MQDGDKAQSPKIELGVDLLPGLYITATPIGHARDITLRALDVLKGCDAIAAEDTRVTAKLLAIYGISKPLFAYNDHNGERERPKILARLQRGERIALVSDAGTPLVSDPGYKLAREALAQGFSVQAIPGASAPLAALTLSGLPSDRFLFAGFLSSKAGERKTALEELRDVRATLIFFESPQRLAASLADMASVLGPRKAAIARELTKKFEEIRRGDLSSLGEHYRKAATPKGEITVVVGAAEDAAPSWDKAERLLGSALEFMPVRAAADLVAEALDLPRRETYARALAKKKNDANDE
ncbi:MAG: 16S rRNA (cytidine(1402)-2'-O)-methyltransferase [Proteobacteria bacterium]|nr:16S rRNA (cytidine(1402)-2'-O)-methyltransferase [Pseudomonadota bacterium]